MKILNQKGISLATAMIIIALITGGTLTIMQQTRNNSLETSFAKDSLFLEMEKKKIYATLSNDSVCKGQNFTTIPALNASIADIKNTSGILVASGNNYVNNSLKLSSITFLAKNSTPGPKDYYLAFKYVSPTGGTLHNSGRNEIIFNINMYFELSGSTVVKCYATNENDQIDKAVEASCSPSYKATSTPSFPASAPNGTSDISNLNYTSGIASQCKVNYSFNTGSVTGDRSSTCNNITSTPSQEQFYGFMMNSNSNGFTPNFLLNSTFCKQYNAAITCSPGEFLYNITYPNVAVCAKPLVTAHDPSSGCATGSALYYPGGVCTSISCSGTNSFVQDVTSGSTSCKTLNLGATCNSGEYIDSFNPTTGAPNCAPMKVISGTCTGNDFGYSILRSTNTLTCQLYNKAKSCTPGITTYAYSIDIAGLSCTSW